MTKEYIKSRHNRHCVICEKDFVTSYPNKHTCSDDCKKKHFETKWGKKSAYGDLPTPTVGAITEVLLATHFLILGYEVFRSLSPACGADLVISKGGKTLRVECRTGYQAKSGKLWFPKKKNGTIDLFAIYVHNTKEIILRHPDGSEEYTLQS